MKLQSRHHTSAENNPCSHADLPGCGGDTERDIPDAGCCNLISKEGEGISECCVLFLEADIFFWAQPSGRKLQNKLG